MRVRRIIKPGAKGTRQLTQQYGDKLICVRYRYDYQLHQRHKTIELIVDTQPWEPPPPHPTEDERPITKETIPEKEVGVQIAYTEKELQRQIKTIGGVWSKTDKLWYAKKSLIQHIGLGDRIVKNR